jgi:hypothetical protein
LISPQSAATADGTTKFPIRPRKTANKPKDESRESRELTPIWFETTRGLLSAIGILISSRQFASFAGTPFVMIASGDRMTGQDIRVHLPSSAFIRVHLRALHTCVETNAH